MQQAVPEFNPLKSNRNKAIQRCLTDALRTLPEREREILTLRYGLAGDEPMTLQAIGQRLGCCKERVRQLEACAFRRLRGPLMRACGELVKV